MTGDDFFTLPPDLPVPVDDGAADRLVGQPVPEVALPSTDGGLVHFTDFKASRTVVYCYPRTSRPGEPPLSEDWDLIPGARGCTPEACSFRDHHAELTALGAEVYGVSTQDTAYQQDAVQRLHLPFPLLSDATLELTRTLQLPTFEVAGQTLIKRLTFLVRTGRIEHVWYPVFPPDEHAEEVVTWLRGHPLRET
ncbi:MAG: redoxin family protein [Micromonosporaceae bacterium]|jgi:peroxiredoxin|nr:redoxin family protein [Micromonosporaceae bacterium]